ncbi:GHMP kinase, partial [Patescibacteria group bacterium]|nr:GHMP kinase [Patescibacteria group bacterium]
MTDKRLTAKAPVRLDFAGGWTDVEEFAHTAHGHVVSATIDRYVTGTRATAEDGSLTISYQSDLPVGCGLGASAALNVVWLNLVRPELAERGDKAAIAEMAYGIEQALGI